MNERYGEVTIGRGRTSAATRPRRRILVMFERMALGVATMILSVNIWSGFPLFALWVGSRAADGNPFSMGGILVVIAVLAVLMAAGLLAFSRLSARYDRLTGRRPAARQPAPWLRSMRAERSAAARANRQVNAVERTVMVTVVATLIAFEIWFFFFAGSPLPHTG